MCAYMYIHSTYIHSMYIYSTYICTVYTAQHELGDLCMTHPVFFGVNPSHSVTECSIQCHADYAYE